MVEESTDSSGRFFWGGSRGSNFLNFISNGRENHVEFRCETKNINLEKAGQVIC